MFCYDGTYPDTDGKCKPTSGYGYALGKLTEAVQFPLPQAPGPPMDLQHAFKYDGLGGRLSQRALRSNFLGTNRYAWDYTYNSQGQIARMFYPTMAFPGDEPKYDQYIEYRYAYGLPVETEQCKCYTIINGEYVACEVDKTEPFCAGSHSERHKTSLVMDRAYHPGGLPETTKYGNGLRMKVGIDAATAMNRPKEMTLLTAQGNTKLWSTGEYEYDGVGNITQQEGELPLGETGASRTKTYTYDALSRLKSFSVSGTGELDRIYTYDAYGNMIKNGQHSIAVDPSTNRLSLTITPVTNGPTIAYAGYDSAGNLQSFGQHRYEWDAAGRMIQYHHVNPGDPTAFDVDYEYWYDVNGERLGECRRTVSAGETEEFTYTIRDESGNVLTEINTDNCPSSQNLGWGLLSDAFQVKTNHYYFGGQLAATEKIDGYTSTACPTWRWYHSDHLGTPRVVTGEDVPGENIVKARHDYWPFGEEITAQGQDDLTHKYTEAERDFESNMDYMMARYYHQFQGRFLSPDPARFYQKTKPQSFNLYAYSMNNPIKYYDPTGMFWEEFWNFLTGEGWSTNEEVEEKEAEEEANKTAEEAEKDAAQEQLLAEAGLDQGNLPKSGGVTGTGDEIQKSGGQFGRKADQVSEKGIDTALTLSLVRGGLNLTKHGLKTLAERGFTEADYFVTKTGIMKTQADGALAFVKEISKGKFNVLVENPQTGKVVTALKNIDAKAVENLAKNYGWK
jgi:RHS repeat-associated protein